MQMSNVNVRFKLNFSLENYSSISMIANQGSNYVVPIIIIGIIYLNRNCVWYMRNSLIPLSITVFWNCFVKKS